MLCLTAFRRRYQNTLPLVPIVRQKNHSTPPHIFFNNCFNIIFKLFLCVSSSLSTSGLLIKTLTHFSSPPYVPYDQPSFKNSILRQIRLSQPPFSLVVVIKLQTVRSHCNELFVPHCTRIITFFSISPQIISTCVTDFVCVS